MEIAIIYAAGWLIATIITACKLWKSDLLDNGTPMKPAKEKTLKTLFSAILGVASWFLVAVYTLMWIYQREELKDRSNITNIDGIWKRKN